MSRVSLAAPIPGWLISARQVPDPVFSEEMMGAGIAIDPTDGALVAPCAAEVLVVAPTHHSVTLRTEAGAELLIHIGLETVALQGRGFRAHVRNGDRVSEGDPLITFDLDLVGLEAKSLVTAIVLTNPGEFRLEPRVLDRVVVRGEVIAVIEGSRRISPEREIQGATRTAEVVIGFEHGLHARPAARIAQCAKAFSSDIKINTGGKSASARSPSAILALNAMKGDRVELSATGQDGKKALESIAALLGAGEDAHRQSPRAVPARALAANEIAGVAALPGVALGTAVHWRRQAIEAAEQQGRGANAERAALEEALALVRARLEAVAAEMSGPAGDVARAHVGLIGDEELKAAAFRDIEGGRSAAAAWQDATSSAASNLRSTENPQLRERVADIDDVARQVTAALLGNAATSSQNFPEGSVVIADELLPSEIMSLPRDRVVGLATADGGPTSHMAIIAASFGIPTLVAMGPQLSRVPDGARVVIDATAGVLVIDPDDRTAERAIAYAKQARKDPGVCVTRDGEVVRLLANLGGLRDVEPALAAGAEGCGLLRTEFLFLDRAEAPSQEEQRSSYQAIADALGERPLTIRTLDIGGDKPVPYIRFPHEQNPALGARGVRTELFKPELLDAQLRAIAQVTGNAIKAMIPMVSSVAELRSVRERLDALGQPVMLGVMVETPAAALIADHLAEHADFLSIGSNDLAQYTLAMDRTNPLLAGAIDALHPAVLRLIAMTAEAGARAGKPVSLCGNLASEPLAALVLIGLGVSELSAVSAALPAVRHAVRQVSASECRSVAKRALELESAGQVRALAAALLTASSEGE